MPGQFNQPSRGLPHLPAWCHTNKLRLACWQVRDHVDPIGPIGPITPADRQSTPRRVKETIQSHPAAPAALPADWGSMGEPGQGQPGLAWNAKSTQLAFQQGEARPLSCGAMGTWSVAWSSHEWHSV